MAAHPVDILFGVTSLVCFVIGTVGNMFAATYFLSRSPAVTPNAFIYSCINITDILICTLALFSGLANLSAEFREIIFSNVFICNLWGMLWNITVRISVYLIGVLCLSRAVTLYRPYTKPSLWSVAIPILFYSLLMVLQAAIPYIHGARYNYIPLYKICTWKLSDLFQPSSTPFKVWFFLFNILEFVLPVIPVVGSCFFMIFKLRTQKSTNRAITSIKREATITIILLTVIYLVWNLPLCVVTTLNYIKICPSAHFSFSIPVRLRSFINAQTILLNSVCNTCLYFYRIADLRKWTVSVTRGWISAVGKWARKKRVVRLPSSPGRVPPDKLSKDMKIGTRNTNLQN